MHGAVRNLIEERLGAFYSTPHGRHFRNARREVLLGLRTLLDRHIEWLDSLGQPEEEPHHVEVE